MLWKAVLAVYWLGCFALTHMPPSDVPPPPFPYTDKIVHFGIYFLLAVLWSINIRNTKITYKKVFAILLIYAICDELSQPYFQRDAEWLDGVADVTGILLGMYSYEKFLKPALQRIISERSRPQELYVHKG